MNEDPLIAVIVPEAEPCATARGECVTAVTPDAAEATVGTISTHASAQHLAKLRFTESPFEAKRQPRHTVSAGEAANAMSVR